MMLRYPSKSDYIDIIVPNLSRFARDARIKDGAPRRNKAGGLFFRQGGMALTFPVNVPGAVYAYRVWFTDLGDLRERYAAINDAFRNGALPWFVESWYSERGVFFNTCLYPTLCMEWVEGETLEELLNARWSDKAFVASLATKFLDVARAMHTNRVSHGDLQQNNIMFTKGAGEIKLIDYDSVWVPSLGNMPQTTAGLPGYQHPLRAKFPHLREKTDYFSELVIYLSLRAIAENRQHWAAVCNTGRLLFDAKDFENPASSHIFSTLNMSSSDDIRKLTAELERFCHESDLSRLKPLEEVVGNLGVATEPVPFPMTAAQEPRKTVDWGRRPAKTSLPSPTKLKWGATTPRPPGSCPAQNTPAASKDNSGLGWAFGVCILIGVCVFFYVAIEENNRDRDRVFGTGNGSSDRSHNQTSYTPPTPAITRINFSDGYYEGETKNRDGKTRHGQGKFIGNNGYRFEGGWLDDKRDGLGECHFADGGWYKGRWRGGKCNGEGEYRWADGGWYKGGWRDGNFNGNGNRRWANGNMYKGEWLNHRICGRGTFSWPNGTRFSGTCISGLSGEPFSGEGTYTYPDGTSKYMLTVGDTWIEWKPVNFTSGNYSVGDVSNGKGKHYWAQSGNWAIGTFANNKLNGEAIFYNAEYKRFDVGQFRNGYRSGRGLMKWDDGDWYEGTWEDGPNGLNGAGTFYHATGRTEISGRWVNGSWRTY